MKDVFTVGEIARYCSVSAGTIGKWVDTGRLTGFRLPGSLTRRVKRECLIAFLKENNLPLYDLEDNAFRILTIGLPANDLKELKYEFVPDDNYIVDIANNGFDVGVLTTKHVYRLIIIDLSFGKTKGITICQRLKVMPKYETTIFSAFVPEDYEIPTQLFDDILCRPFNLKVYLETLVARIEDQQC